MSSLTFTRFWVAGVIACGFLVAGAIVADPVSGQENRVIVIECIAKQKIKKGRELFSRDGEFRGSKVDTYLLLKKGEKEFLVRDVLSPFVSEKKLRFVLTKKKAQTEFQLSEVWDSNLQVFPNKTSAQLRAELTDRLDNSFPVPKESQWVTENGFQFQLTTVSPFAFTNATTFEYYIWIRNPGKIEKKFPMIAGPRFVPHFELQVETELGRSMMLGECAKKHATQTILIRAGETKSFKCDLFSSSCTRVKPFHEMPMAYVLSFHGAKLRFFTEEPAKETQKISRCPVRPDEKLD